MNISNKEKEILTRSEILAASKELFCKYGLNKTTMNDIAKACGKGKSSLYYYFKSKEEVFYAAAEEEKNEIVSEINKAVENAKTSSEKLKAIFVTRIKILQTKAILYSIFLKNDLDKYISLYNRIKSENNTAASDMIEKILVDGIKRKEFVNISVKCCKNISRIITKMIRGIDMNILFSNMREDEKAADISKIADIFIAGLKINTGKSYD